MTATHRAALLLAAPLLLVILLCLALVAAGLPLVAIGAGGTVLWGAGFVGYHKARRALGIPRRLRSGRSWRAPRARPRRGHPAQAHRVRGGPASRFARAGSSRQHSSSRLRSSRPGSSRLHGSGRKASSGSGVSSGSRGSRGAGRGRGLMGGSRRPAAPAGKAGASMGRRAAAGGHGSGRGRVRQNPAAPGTSRLRARGHQRNAAARRSARIGASRLAAGRRGARALSGSHRPAPGSSRSGARTAARSRLSPFARRASPKTRPRLGSALGRRPHTGDRTRHSKSPALPRRGRLMRRSAAPNRRPRSGGMLAGHSRFSQRRPPGRAHHAGLNAARRAHTSQARRHKPRPLFTGHHQPRTRTQRAALRAAKGAGTAALLPALAAGYGIRWAWRRQHPAPQRRRENGKLFHFPGQPRWPDKPFFAASVQPVPQPSQPAQPAPAPALHSVRDSGHTATKTTGAHAMQNTHAIADTISGQMGQWAPEHAVDVDRELESLPLVFESLSQGLGNWAEKIADGPFNTAIPDGVRELAADVNALTERAGEIRARLRQVHAADFERLEQRRAEMWDASTAPD